MGEHGQRQAGTAHVDAWSRPRERRGACLPHDLSCRACGHARHTYLPCSDTCACEPPEVPGVPAGTPRVA